MNLYDTRWHSGERSLCGRSLVTDPVRKAKRGLVEGLSKQSRTRMRRYLENCTAQYRAMITLTYSSCPTDGRAVKRHLTAFAWQLSAYKLQPTSLFWILEFQRRGSPHYHLMSTHYVPKWAISWLWHFASNSPPKTATNVQTIRKPLQYALKYAQKLEQKQVPAQYQSVGRLWGVIGSREMFHVERDVVGIPRSDIGGIIEYERFCEEKAARRVCNHAAGFVSFTGKG